MILKFYVKNFAIINEMEIEFTKGLNVLTGETGAGKSIIIGALEFLLGGRFGEWMLKDKNKEMLVEGKFKIHPLVKETLKKYGFEIKSNEISIKRKASGKKVTSYLNNVPVSASFLSEVGELLVDIHGQHEHQYLLKEKYQRETLDTFASNSSLLEDLRKRLREYRVTKKRIEELKKEIERIEREKEFYEFQIKEIDDAGIKPGEYEELKKERELIISAEKRYELATNALNILSEGDGALVEKISFLQNIFIELSEKDKSMKKYLEKIAEIQAEIDELWREITAYKDRIEFSEERLNEIESRLFLLERLMKKYNRDEEELLKYRDEIKKKIDSLSFSRDELLKLEIQKGNLEKEIKEIVERISVKRREKAKELSQKVMKELSLLGFTNAIFDIEFEEKKEIDETGKEKVRFVFSANPGIIPKPLSVVISGGELSRIMLSIKTVLVSEDIVSTLVFDEIDVGIGGKTADTVGRKLKNIASVKQVIVITHLPQIARFADTHFRVTKKTTAEETITEITRIEKEERIKEIARMLGGEKITPTTLSHAKELLERE